MLQVPPQGGTANWGIRLTRRLGVRKFNGFIQRFHTAEAEPLVHPHGGLVLGRHFEIDTGDAQLLESRECRENQRRADAATAMVGSHTDVLDAGEPLADANTLDCAAHFSLMRRGDVLHQPSGFGEKAIFLANFLHQSATAVEFAEAIEQHGVDFVAKAVVFRFGVILDLARRPADEPIALRHADRGQPPPAEVDFHAKTFEVGEAHRTADRGDIAGGRGKVAATLASAPEHCNLPPERNGVKFLKSLAVGQFSVVISLREMNFRSRSERTTLSGQTDPLSKAYDFLRRKDFLIYQNLGG